MLNDAAILGLLHGLICLSQEELFKKLLFSKRKLRNFIKPYLFQVIEERYGLNKKYYPVGNLALCLLIHLGRKFEVPLPQNYTHQPQHNFVQDVQSIEERAESTHS